MYEFLPSKQFPGNNINLGFEYDLGLIGESVDTRGNVSVRIVRDHSKLQHELKYDHDNLSVRHGNSHIALKEYLKGSCFEGIKSLLIDSTNLPFAEIAIALRAALRSGAVERISFVYCEPDEYKMCVWTPTALRGFELTEKLNEFDFIPTFYSSYVDKNSYLLAFLGFEDTRFKRVIDPDLGGGFSGIGAAFSVPPFQTGFDNHSLMANSRVLHDSNITEPFFVAGNQPYDALELIGRVWRARKSESESLVLAPLGTKPNAIAVALAAAEDEEISVIFDFPVKRSNRSEGIGTSHYFPIRVS
ncbi:MAG: hypothetical protein JXR18_14060 [Neptuniibacter sp.]